MNEYLKLKKKHQEEVNNFPIKFSFSNKQFDEGMGELGLDPETDRDKVVAGFAGAFYKKTDAPRLRDMLNRHAKERKEAIAGDLTGEGYIYNMFDYELANHEYCVTMDETDALEALGITHEEIQKNEALSNGFIEARRNQWDSGNY